jgi:hypothetical protein
MHRVTVLETPNKSFHLLGKKLSAALADEGFILVPAKKLVLAARRQGLSFTALTDEQLRAAGKAAGVDLVVRAKATGASNAFAVQLAVEATDGRKRIYATRAIVSGSRLDSKTAGSLAHAIHSADDANAKTEDESGFSPGEPVVSEEGENLTTEEAEEEEDLDPEQTRITDAPRDGFIVSAGFAALMRNAQSRATTGTPPRYDGALSPGVAFQLAVFPGRFQDHPGAGGDFGLFVRGVVGFMPSELGGGASPAAHWDTYYSFQGGLAFRHVFGVTNKDVALGAELALRGDFMHLANDLPYPDTLFLSPSVNISLEAPLWRKHLVLLTRFGVMPVSGIASDQANTFGARKLAFGIDAMVGLRVPLYRGVLYAEVAGVLTCYWQSYSGTGSAGFSDVNGYDWVAGGTVSLGVNY